MILMLLQSTNIIQNRIISFEVPDLTFTNVNAQVCSTKSFVERKGVVLKKRLLFNCH